MVTQERLTMTQTRGRSGGDGQSSAPSTPFYSREHGAWGGQGDSGY